MTKAKRVENMRILGMTFLFLHEENPEREVDMLEGTWSACGTIACFAGWFAVARGKDNDGTCYTYADSATEMAQFLGFSSRQELIDLFSQRDDVWGNYYAGYMFCGWEAFDPRCEKPRTLKTIGEHWLAVADRYEAKL